MNLHDKEFQNALKNKDEIIDNYKRAIFILKEIQEKDDFELMEKIIYKIAQLKPTEFVIAYNFVKNKT